MEKFKILEALANSFMAKTSKNTPHFLFDFAYNLGALSSLDCDLLLNPFHL